MEESNIFKKNRISIELLLRDAIEFTVSKYKQARANFTVASAYGQILFVLQNLSQLILFYISDSIEELNIRTATRSNSVYGLASLAGHNPTRAIAATGEVSLNIKSTANDAGALGGSVIISNFTKLRCLNNNIEYLVDLPGDELRLRLDNSVNGTNIKIIQGTIETQVFTGNNTPLQTFSCNVQQSSMVDNFTINVYVNGEKWTKYDSLYDMPKDKKGYLIRTGITGGIDVVFGNSFFGNIPPLGSQIQIEYLITNGGLGNVQLTDNQKAEYEWIDTGFDVFGNEIDLNQVYSITNVNPPDFGTNPEPLALTRLVAPKTSRSYVLANPDNYIIFLEKFNIFSIIDAYTTFDDNNLKDDNVIFLFLIPDVTKRLKTNENYFNLTEDKFILTDSQKEKIVTLIEKSGSKIVTTEVQIVDPIVSRYVINIALIVFEGFNEDSIRQEILSRLSDYFLSVRRRDRIPRSDLISIIESVSGVDSINMSIISEKDEIAYIQNPNAVPIGLDEFGDIIIQSEELPIIRGGWTDRNGIEYASDINPSKASSVNMIVKAVVPVSYNTKVNMNNKNNIKG